MPNTTAPAARTATNPLAWLALVAAAGAVELSFTICPHANPAGNAAAQEAEFGALLAYAAEFGIPACTAHAMVDQWAGC